MSTSMPMLLVITLMTLGIIIVLIRQTGVQLDPNFDRGDDSTDNTVGPSDFTGESNPVEDIEAIFASVGPTGPTPTDESIGTASGSIGPTPTDESIGTASGSIGPTPMDESVGTASGSIGPAPAPVNTDAIVTPGQLNDILYNTTNPDGTPFTLSEQTENAERVVDVIHKIETHNAAVAIDDHAEATLDEIGEKLEEAETAIENVLEIQNVNIELDKTDTSKISDLSKEIADVEIEAAAKQAIIEEEFQLRQMDIQRQLDEIREQQLYEERRVALADEKRKNDHLSKMSQYELDNEQRQDNVDKMKNEISQYELDETRLRLSIANIQAEVTLAKEIEAKRLENELLKLDVTGDAQSIESERSRLQQASDNFTRNLGVEIIQANADLVMSINARALVFENVTAKEEEIQASLNDAAALDSRYALSESERFSAIDADARYRGEEYDELYKLSQDVQTDHTNITLAAAGDLSESINALEGDRRRITDAIQARKDENDNLLKQAEGDLTELQNEYLEAENDRLAAAKARLGTQAAMKRGSDLLMYETSITYISSKQVDMIDDINSGQISDGARVHCLDQTEKYNTCRLEVDTLNRQLTLDAEKIKMDHVYKKAIGFDIDVDVHTNMVNIHAYKTYIGFDIEPSDHSLLATNQDTVKVIKPVEDRTIRAIDGKWFYVGDGGIDNPERFEITETLVGVHSGPISLEPLLELDLKEMGYETYSGLVKTVTFDGVQSTNDIIEVLSPEYMESMGYDRYENTRMDEYLARNATPAEILRLNDADFDTVEVQCVSQSIALANCQDGLTPEGIPMTDAERAEYLSNQLKWDLRCKSDPNIEPIEPQDCYITWDESTCKKPKILGVEWGLSPLPADYGTKTATVEYPPMFGGSCAYKTGDVINCSYDDTSSEARDKIDQFGQVLGSMLGI